MFYLEFVVPVFAAFMVRSIVLKLIDIIGHVKFPDFFRHVIAVHRVRMVFQSGNRFYTAYLNELAVFRFQGLIRFLGIGG